MVTGSNRDALDRAREIAASNPGVDTEKVKRLIDALESLQALGIRPRGYNLLAPTDSVHAHSDDPPLHLGGLDEESGRSAGTQDRERAFASRWGE
jgi:hypothetical protein